MQIETNWLVLEIGSGNNPHPRSDILCDRFIYDNGQRAGKFSIVIDRPMIVADGYKLPFPDKSFDYIICSHILEHMADPKAFLTEVARVGKAGYIEVPSSTAERLFGWSFHLWYSEKKSDKLTLFPKKDDEKYDGFFHRLIANTIWFRRFFEQHENYFNIKYEWKNSPQVIISKKQLRSSDLRILDKKNWVFLKDAYPDILKDTLFWINWMQRRIVKKGKKLIRIFYWRIKQIFEKNQIIQNILVYMCCPNCKMMNMKREGENFFCTTCNIRYKLDGILPIMILPTAQKIKY